MDFRRDKPMPNIVFRGMSAFFVVRDKFRKPEKLLQKAGIAEGQTVLDFGCGPGSYAIAAARIVGAQGKVHALDIHPLAARSVERRAAKRGLSNLSTIVSNRDTGLPDESVDVVLAYDMIHMVKDREALLVELHRVLKQGGVLSILAEHMKPEHVLDMAISNGLFTLRDRHGRLLNFERRGPG
jgi:ubiquinone/menaquinone biosynthesis C-methylase UbiE